MFDVIINLSSCLSLTFLKKILIMKRLFNPRKKSEGETPDPGNTLDRIVKDKEGVKKRLEEEEKSFMSKKKEYERKMIEFEKQEVGRREQEISEKKAALDDMKRKNQMVQDKVQEQIKTLTMKLEELRVEHMTNEASQDSIISCLNDKLSEVQRSLNERLLNFETYDQLPSAPHEVDDGDDEDGGSRHLYPSLHNLPTMPRSWHQIYSATQTSSPFRSISLHAVDPALDMSQSQPENISSGGKKGGNSLGSSPQISLASSSSSRSNTPKLESDDTSV